MALGLRNNNENAIRNLPTPDDTDNNNRQAISTFEGNVK